MERDLGHRTPMSKPTTLRTSTDGNTIMINGGAGVKIFDPVRDQALGISQDIAAIDGDPASFSLAPDGRLIAQSLDDGAIVLWDLRQSRTLGEAFDGKMPSPSMALLGPGMTKSPSFVLWDTATRRQSGAPITTGHGDITTLVFSPNRPDLSHRRARWGDCFLGHRKSSARWRAIATHGRRCLPSRFQPGRQAARQCRQLGDSNALGCRAPPGRQSSFWRKSSIRWDAWLQPRWPILDGSWLRQDFAI